MPTCPRCGAELGSADPAGLCPRCLIQGAFESSIAGGDAHAETIGPTDLTSDDDFGRYQIIRSLGEGGMGTVYLAEQLEPIRRRVALKVVKSGMDTAQVLARFNNERQTMALMDHPNIAQIFDAAATRSGRPYFVMEYIDGAPITQYCDRTRMTTKARLSLFLAVCRAIHHAHQKRVIHRDLKPSNVLVTEQDGAPIPKVIDFGIAKATDKWARENTLITHFGQIIGTPEYASPEQADSMTGDVDQSSDVYSLGVVMYELLIGAVPFETTTLRNAGLAEMLRIIREEEAPSLSRKLTSMGAVATDVAARRQTDAASLRRLVDGDLNAITMKALEKSRERRYASVSDLAADIQRHLEDRPVLAARRGGVYRARKFLRRHRLVALGAAAGLVLVVLSGVSTWSLWRRESAATPTLTDKDTLVLADFDNKTGDAVFDDTLRQGLSVALHQSPFLSLIADQQVQQVLPLMGLSRDARLTPDVALQVCARTGSAAVLEGSIASVGTQYVLGLRARRCNDGTLLDQEQAVAARREDVLNSLSQMARDFRTRVGESLATVQEHSTPLAEATTPSLDALKAYTSGVKAALTLGNSVAIPYYRRAIEIDPMFAMAHASLGLSYSADGESALAAESTKRAWQLRDRVSDAERFFIDFTYDRQVTGNLEKAYHTLELWFETYPHAGAPRPETLMGGLAGHGTGRFDRAIEVSQKAVAENPTGALAYGALSQTYFLTDRFGDAERVLRLASERKLDVPDLPVIRYNIGVLKGDRQMMDEAVRLARGKRRVEHLIAHEEALALARSGQLAAARRSSNRAVDLAQQEGADEEAVSYQAARSVWEAFYGNAAEAKKMAAATLAQSHGSRDVTYVAGLALVLSGDIAQAEVLADDLEKRFPEDTFAKFGYVPVLRASAALARGKPADSIDVLQTALRYELAANGLNFNHWYLGGLHSAYVRGEALLTMRRYPEAAVEFQKILDHRGLVASDPIGALAHLQLGRTFALSGDKGKAKAAYDTFFALWKDADADVPILKSARAEYARLQP